jgi:hypothetical protein
VADITGTFLLGPDSGRVLVKTGRAGLFFGALKLRDEVGVEVEADLERAASRG